MTQPIWNYQGKPITEVSDLPDNVHGFVYMITDENGKKYIGKKTIFTVRKRKFGKKESKLITDKRLKLYETVRKEGNWKIYTGSNTILNEGIKKGLQYTKEIIRVAYHKKQLSYYETRELFEKRVLETDDDYYNSNINGTYFKKDTEIK